MHTREYDEMTHAIAHNGSDVIHAVTVEPGATLYTGQEHLEEFTEWAEWEARLVELGYDTTTLETSDGPVAEPTANPVIDEPVAEPVINEPVAEPTAEPVIDEPVAEPTAEPVIDEPVAEPLAEQL